MEQKGGERRMSSEERLKLALRRSLPLILACMLIGVAALVAAHQGPVIPPPSLGHGRWWLAVVAVVVIGVVVIAAMNLVLDFDFIESGARQSAPKYMEWYAAFGLMVTLIWLYLEILRLLAKLNRR